MSPFSLAMVASRKEAEARCVTPSEAGLGDDGKQLQRTENIKKNSSCRGKGVNAMRLERGDGKRKTAAVCCRAAEEPLNAKESGWISV